MTSAPAKPTGETPNANEVLTGRLSDDQERAMHVGLGRTRRDMLAGRQGALAKVVVERHLVVLVGQAFTWAVSEARAEGFGWEQIAEQVPGFKTTYGVEAAEKFFESVSVVNSRLENYFSWRCGDCDGLVLDRGPYGGHPADTQPGHREACGRLESEVSAYLGERDGLDVKDEPAAPEAWPAATDASGLPPSSRPIESPGPVLDL